MVSVDLESRDVAVRGDAADTVITNYHRRLGLGFVICGCSSTPNIALQARIWLERVAVWVTSGGSKAVINSGCRTSRRGDAHVVVCDRFSTFQASIWTEVTAGCDSMVFGQMDCDYCE
jgi:hypothetical protein